MIPTRNGRARAQRAFTRVVVGRDDALEARQRLDGLQESEGVGRRLDTCWQRRRRCSCCGQLVTRFPVIGPSTGGVLALPTAAGASAPLALLPHLGTQEMAE